MSEFYYPKTKRELVDLLGQRYPSDIFKFKKMSKEQLRAIRQRIIKQHLQSTKGTV